LEASQSKAEVLASLRADIATLERGSVAETPADATPAHNAWVLGAPEFDCSLGAGLDPASLHEVKPAPEERGVTAGDWAAALGFTLRLAVRRLEGLASPSSHSDAASILWCWPSQFARELGAPYGRGLGALGLSPSTWLFVETSRASEALWAMEEGLRSQSLALVIGVLNEVELTPSRRLSLVAAEHSTPCLLVTDPRLSAAGSTATRWRVGRCSSAAHPFDVSAPGAPRYTVALERCRHRPMTHEGQALQLEWSDETHRFHMAAAVAGRAPAPRAAGAGAR
jgi:protein ImuA